MRHKRFNPFKIAPHLPFLLTGFMALSFLAGCGASDQKISSKDLSMVNQPVLNRQSSEDDFAFPSRPPRLSNGKKVFEQNCATCHHGNLTYEQIKGVRPIDTYLMLTRGDNHHPLFKQLTRDQRWEAVFYARYLANGGYVKNPNKDIAAAFGSNCAVCHGAKGYADGPLYSGHASAHELGMAPVKGAFDPPPANFHSYSRMYNRSDDLLVKNIQEGIYPSAMPSWMGRKDMDKNLTFDEPTIRDFVKYVRSFAYEDDLPQEDSAAPAATGKSGAAAGTAPAKSATPGAASAATGKTQEKSST